VPTRIWFEIAERARKWTGYTRQWRREEVQPLRRLLMASVLTPEEAFEAWSRSWRTFRVRLPEESPLAYEAPCPASKEEGRRMSCLECGQCNGARPIDVRNSYTTIVHGSGQKAYRSVRLRVLS
jgi:hypothetical protein